MKPKIKDISDVKSDRTAMDFFIEKSIDVYEATKDVRGSLCIAIGLCTSYWHARTVIKNYRTCAESSLSSVIGALKPQEKPV